MTTTKNSIKPTLGTQKQNYFISLDVLAFACRRRCEDLKKQCHET